MQLPLKYHGGKSYLASKIRSLFPEHKHYVEPFFGSGAVLFSGTGEGVSEVANDIDARLTNFWRTLQREETRNELVDLIRYTPVSEVEWDLAFKAFEEHSCPFCIGAGGISPCVRCAWRFFILNRQSMAGRMLSFTPRSRTRLRRGMNEQASAWWSALDSIESVADRLSRVVILNENATNVIKKEDGTRTLFYVDPPYMSDTRTAKDVYRYEMTADQHLRLLDRLVTVRGFVVLSGYPNTTYHTVLHSWYRVDFKMPNHSASGAEKRVMTEVLWMNFNPSMLCMDSASMEASDGPERSVKVSAPVDFQVG